MVKALYGKCQGKDINFQLNEATGRWETAVPASPDGTYIIELWAEDYAGNIGYFATIEVTFDSSQLCFSIKILSVGAQFTMEQVKQALCLDGMRFCVPGHEIAWAVAPDIVMSSVIRCEVCGR